MYQNKKTIKYATEMKKAREAGEVENALVFFEKLLDEVKKEKKKV